MHQRYFRQGSKEVLNSHIIYLMFVLPFCLQMTLSANVMFWLNDWIIAREIHVQVNPHPWISSGDLNHSFSLTYFIELWLWIKFSGMHTTLNF